MNDHTDDPHAGLVADEYRIDFDHAPAATDELGKVFDAYKERRPPRDVVPKSPVAGGLDDLHALAGTTQEIAHYTVGDDGITKHVEHLTITRPISRKDH